MDLRVRKPDGWTTVSLDDDVEEVTVAGGRTDGHLSLTLIGVRSSQPNVRVLTSSTSTPTTSRSWRVRFPGR